MSCANTCGNVYCTTSEVRAGSAQQLATAGGGEEMLLGGECYWAGDAARLGISKHKSVHANKHILNESLLLAQ
jgi:hypothetical protein